MQSIEKSIEVNAPLTVAYNQWTQFEEFPRFMEGVESVQQMGDKRLHWKAEIGGKVLEWDAEIFEQVPDQRIAWRSVAGTMNSGMVNFESVNSEVTRVSLKLNYDPEGAIEKLADALGVVSRRVEGDLQRFKEYIEARGVESGGWRGEIRGRQVGPLARDRLLLHPGIRRSREASGFIHFKEWAKEVGLVLVGAFAPTGFFMNDFKLKGPIAPMEARSVVKIPAGSNWKYEPKWDGFPVRDRPSWIHSGTLVEGMHNQKNHSLKLIKHSSGRPR